jgi:hypothetical protein
VRVDPPLGRRMQTYATPVGPVLSHTSSVPPPPVQPPRHTASGRFVHGICMPQCNLLMGKWLPEGFPKSSLQSLAESSLVREVSTPIPLTSSPGSR